MQCIQRPLLWMSLAISAAIGCGSHSSQKKADDPMLMFASEAAAAPEASQSKASAPQKAEPDSQNAGANLSGLNMLLRDYVRATRKVPKDLNELVSSGFISALPSPPPGKRFAILMHPLGYQVVLIDN